MSFLHFAIFDISPSHNKYQPLTTWFQIWLNQIMYVITFLSYSKNCWSYTVFKILNTLWCWSNLFCNLSNHEILNLYWNIGEQKMDSSPVISGGSIPFFEWSFTIRKVYLKKQDVKNENEKFLKWITTSRIGTLAILSHVFHNCTWQRTEVLLKKHDLGL